MCTNKIQCAILYALATTTTQITSTNALSPAKTGSDSLEAFTDCLRRSVEAVTYVKVGTYVEVEVVAVEVVVIKAVAILPVIAPVILSALRVCELCFCAADQRRLRCVSWHTHLPCSEC